MVWEGTVVYIVNARIPTEKAHGYQISKMCEAFAALGCNVTLLYPKRDNPLKGKTLFDYYGIPPKFSAQALPNWDVFRLEGWLPRRVFTALVFTHAFIWAYYAVRCAAPLRADLYYTRDVAVAYWLTRFGLPTVYEAHGVPKRARWWLLGRMAGRSELRLVVALTSFIRDGIVRIGVPQEKAVVLPDGVDLSLFADLPGKVACRRRLGLPLDRPLVGYIGRFRTMEMEKGIPELVEAMGYLPQVNGAEPLLVCVGGPMDAVPAYLDLARQKGVPRERLQFVDRVPNMEVPYWIRACDVVAIPWPWTEFSAYFTSPLKLFEYMAAGVPIVATDLPAIREVLRHGENAWLVPPGDAKALAEGIRYLLAHPPLAQRLARTAQEEVQQYTWEARAAAILKHVSGKGRVDL